MRDPCKFCGERDGRIITKSGQDCVHCVACDKWQYNAPKTETGRKPRSVSTTHRMVKPGQRSRIIARANRRCERCGKPAHLTTAGLHAGHFLSVSDGHKLGLDDRLLNSDDNLIAECDECNSGHNETLPLHLIAAILKARELGYGG